VILHITQSLSWIEKSRRSAGQSNSALPPARITFYADALNTLSLLDASILSGSRSASYETRTALDPIPGLPDAPEFGSKLTITVLSCDCHEISPLHPRCFLFIYVNFPSVSAKNNSRSSLEARFYGVYSRSSENRARHQNKECFRPASNSQ